MLLYMLIHTNKQFLSYLLARSDVDALVRPHYDSFINTAPAADPLELTVTL
jgi:hypothetical protein